MTDPASQGFDMTRQLLQVIGKIIDRLPNYPQKKRKQYYKMLEDYEKEMSRDYETRDDNTVGICKNDLERFVKVFNKDIELNVKIKWEKEE